MCNNDACAITIISNKVQHTYRLQQTYTIVYSNYGDTVYMLQQLKPTISCRVYMIACDCFIHLADQFFFSLYHLPDP